jgi:hypothetical protein
VTVSTEGSEAIEECAQENVRVRNMMRIMSTKRSSAKRSATRSGAVKRKTASRRELIEPKKGAKRFVRRNATGEFKNVVDVGRSLAADRRRKSKTKVAKGQGDRGETR